MELNYVMDNLQFLHGTATYMYVQISSEYALITLSNM